MRVCRWLFAFGKMFGERHVMSYLMSYSKELIVRNLFGGTVIDLRHTHIGWEKLISIWTVAGEELRFMFLPIGK